MGIIQICQRYQTILRRLVNNLLFYFLKTHRMDSKITCLMMTGSWYYSTLQRRYCTTSNGPHPLFITQEMFTPSTGFKLMHSRLKVHWTVRQQRDEITFDRLKMAALIIFGLPREKFSLAEVGYKNTTCSVSTSTVQCST